jgi:FAD/FMN-containing dehydrogenase
MRGVSVDPKTKIVTAEGGCLWADVDKAAEEHGLAVVGGTVNTTGVGGLTIHGGYGFRSGENGLVIDNLLEVEMVLADGKIVTASRHKHIDLFWAVRGAGSSFGVVTSFTYLGHEQKRPVWGGTLLINVRELDKVVAFANKFLEVRCLL